MPTLVQTGNSIDYTPTAAVTAGDVVDLSGDFSYIGIAPNDIAANAKGAVQVKGVFLFDLATGKTFDVGDKVYVDSSDDATDVSANTYAGVAIADSTSAGVLVDINVSLEDAASS